MQKDVCLYEVQEHLKLTEVRIEVGGQVVTLKVHRGHRNFLDAKHAPYDALHGVIRLNANMKTKR